MHTIGVVAFTEHGLYEVADLETGLSRAGYPVHIEPMRGKPQSTQLTDFYYEENAILLWLCRCYGDLERCHEAIECFVDAKVDLIITMAPEAFSQAVNLVGTSGIPIIFTHLSKSQYREYISKVATPVKAITDVFDTWEDIVEERVALFTEVVPTPKTIHTIYDPDNPHLLQELENLRLGTQGLGLNLVEHPAHTAEEIKQILDKKSVRAFQPVQG